MKLGYAAPCRLWFRACSLVVPLVAIASTSTAAPEAAVDEQTLEANIRRAVEEKGPEEAARFYEALGERQEPQTQDEAASLYWAANLYAQSDRLDKALPLWRRILNLPLAPGASRAVGGARPQHIDRTGDVLWRMAEALRAAGRWSEAVPLYQRNREFYPLYDGCVHSGATAQHMALVEGVCLEQLGRTSEAVEIYWPAALQLDYSQSPYAMRRLVDIYLARGQLPLLAAAVERERRAFDAHLQENYGADPGRDQFVKEHQLGSAFPAFDRILRARTAAVRRDWPTLLAMFRAPEEKERAWPELDVAELQRQEAYSALSTVDAAIPVLKRALEKEPEDVHLLAALLSCCGLKQRQEWWDAHPKLQRVDLQWLLRDEKDSLRWPPPTEFPKPSATAVLPAELPVVHK